MHKKQETEVVDILNFPSGINIFGNCEECDDRSCCAPYKSLKLKAMLDSEPIYVGDMKINDGRIVKAKAIVGCTQDSGYYRFKDLEDKLSIMHDEKKVNNNPI